MRWKASMASGWRNSAAGAISNRPLPGQKMLAGRSESAPTRDDSTHEGNCASGSVAYHSKSTSVPGWRRSAVGAISNRPISETEDARRALGERPLPESGCHIRAIACPDALSWEKYSAFGRRPQTE